MYQRTSAIYQKIADDGGHQELRDTCCARPLVGYPRSPLRRGFDVGCSISQNIQTKAVPRPTTTPRNTNVRAGAVSMFNIPDAMQAAYQRTQSTAASMQ
jgi:hypothetical protein